MKAGSIRSDQADGVIVPHAWLADRWHTRLRGLLARAPLQKQARQALWITPCSCIHTMGMAYPLDIVFLDGDDRICGWHEGIVPRRFATCRKARSTIEFHAGGVEIIKPEIGCRWYWQANQSEQT